MFDVAHSSCDTSLHFKLQLLIDEVASAISPCRRVSWQLLLEHLPCDFECFGGQDNTKH